MDDDNAYAALVQLAHHLLECCNNPVYLWVPRIGDEEQLPACARSIQDPLRADSFVAPRQQVRLFQHLLEMFAGLWCLFSSDLTDALGPGSPWVRRTTEAVRRAIQHNQASPRAAD